MAIQAVAVCHVLWCIACRMVSITEAPEDEVIWVQQLMVGFSTEQECLLESLCKRQATVSKAFHASGLEAYACIVH